MGGGKTLLLAKCVKVVNGSYAFAGIQFLHIITQLLSEYNKVEQLYGVIITKIVL